MKKTLILSVAALCSAFTAWANPIDRQTAQGIADQWMSHHSQRQVKTVLLSVENSYECEGADVKSRMATHLTIANGSDQPAYYLFHAEQQPGFVIVAGDDTFPQIFGYSLTQILDEKIPIPDALTYLLDCYTEQVMAVRQGRMEAPASSESMLAASGLPATVAPLLKSVWGQGNPYNLLCPKDGGSTVPCGCVATAMAQMMYYHKFPAQGRGNIAYNSTNIGGTITKDLSTSFYHWELMGDTRAENLQPGAKETVAELCYDCGISVAMNYNRTGSGAYDDNTMRALVRNFSYKASTIQRLRRTYYSSAEEWINIIKKELAESRPVFYSAVSSTNTTGDGAGHAFVLDGYDSRNFVHVNWGWDGSYDGYFDIALLNPSGYQFSEYQSAIIGIIPDETGEDNVFPQSRVMMASGISTTSSVVNRTQSFKVNFPTYANSTLVTKNFTMGVGLFDKHGNFLAEIFGAGKTERLTGNSYGGSAGRAQVSIPASYPEGDYQVRVVFREEGFEDWILPYVIGGAETNLIPCYVTDDAVYLNQVSTGIAQPSVSAATVVRTELYDMSGRRLSDQSAAMQGLVLESTTLSDGTVQTRKRLLR